MGDTLAFSRFTSRTDTIPKPMQASWPELVVLLNRTWSPQPEGAGKEGLPALSGAWFRPGGSRRTGDVLAVAFLGLDFDNATSEPAPSGALHPSGAPKLVKVPLAQPAHLSELAEHLAARDAAAFLYSTWSSSPGWPRFRVLLPFAVPLPPDLLPQASEWALAHLALEGWRACLDVPAMRRAAGLWFLPAALDPAAVERREVKGAPLAPSLADLPRVEVPLPPLAPHQAAHLAQRKSQGHRWAARFKASDGTPLDIRTLDIVRLLEGLGAKVGPARPAGAAVKHRTTCPWWTEHSHPEPANDAVIYVQAGRWPTWSCPHACHVHLSLPDLLEAAGCLR